MSEMLNSLRLESPEHEFEDEDWDDEDDEFVDSDGEELELDEYGADLEEDDEELADCEDLVALTYAWGSARAHRVNLDQREPERVRRSGRTVLLGPGGGPLGRPGARPAVLRVELDTALARLLSQPARRLSSGQIPVAADMGRLLCGGRLQQSGAGEGRDIIKLFLTRSSIPGSSYSTAAAAFFVEAVFDVCAGVLVLIFAFSQGVFPKPPDFSKLSLLRHLLPGRPFQADAVLDHRTGRRGPGGVRAAVGERQAFWTRVRQGVTILTDRKRYLREVAAWQAGAWVCGFAGYWLLLDAFGVGGSSRTSCLVFGLGQVAGAVPFTPGGLGVQQALLVKVFSASAPAVVVAYSVGQSTVAGGTWTPATTIPAPAASSWPPAATPLTSPSPPASAAPTSPTSTSTPSRSTPSATAPPPPQASPPPRLSHHLTFVTSVLRQQPRDCKTVAVRLPCQTLSLVFGR